MSTFVGLVLLCSALQASTTYGELLPGLQHGVSCYQTSVRCVAMFKETDESDYVLKGDANCCFEAVCKENDVEVIQRVTCPEEDIGNGGNIPPCPQGTSLQTVPGNCCKQCVPGEATVAMFPETLRVKQVATVSGEDNPRLFYLDVVAGQLLVAQRVGFDPTFSTQIAEFNPQTGDQVRVLQDGIPGQPRGLTSTRSGDLYVTTLQVLVRVTAVFGDRNVVREGMYGHCTVDPNGSTVYAVRIDDEQVLVDIVVDGAIYRSVKTDVPFGQLLTVGVTSQRNVVYLSSDGDNRIYRIRLIDGSILTTYGQAGSEAPGEMNGPTLYVLDPNAREIIVADRFNDRLQILNPDDETFMIVSVEYDDEEQRLSRPNSVIVFQDNVYVAGDNGRKLFILEKND